MSLAAGHTKQSSLDQVFSSNQLTQGQKWQAPLQRIVLKRNSGTPGAADFSRELNAYAQSNNLNMIVMAQGNHHPDYGRMSAPLHNLFNYPSPSDPVYKNDPGTTRELKRNVAAWEQRMMGAPATEEGTLLIKQQGRFALGMGLIAASQYLKQPQSIIVPNLRWRVVDSHIQYNPALNPVDYDVTADDIASSVRQAVSKAGGPQNIGMLYLCSPNNPTGRRLGADEYRDIVALTDDINNARMAKGLPRMLVICDDPYFEACPIRHTDFDRAQQGDHYLKTGYEGLRGARNTPFLILHSFSKFAEQAGGNGMTVAVSTDPEFTAIYKNVLTTMGGLAYTNEFVKQMGYAFAPDPRNDSLMLERCQEASDLFATNRKIFDDVFGEYALAGQPNMVGCVRVPKALYVGREITYPNGEKILMQDIDDLVEALGNFAGVGLVPEKNDRKVWAEGYNPKNEDLIRFAFNNDPQVSVIGIQRALECVLKIAQQPIADMYLEQDKKLAAKKSASHEFSYVNSEKSEHLAVKWLRRIAQGREVISNLLNTKTMARYNPLTAMHRRLGLEQN
jgi:aspartate/methionine/tyrosine aminotransferase